MPKNKNKNPKALLSWTTSSSFPYARGRLWKALMALIALALILWGATHEALTFSLAIVTFGLVYYLIHRKEDELIQISIFDDHLDLGDAKIPFKNVVKYWIINEGPHHQELYLRLSHKFFPDLRIQLFDLDQKALRAVLKDKITEDIEAHLGLSEAFLRLFKI